MQPSPASLPPPQHPAPFGHWQLRGGRLTCRLPDRQLVLRGPAGLLRALVDRCDGSQALDALVAALAAQWDATQVRALLLALARAGALVDAGTLLAHWTRATQHPDWLRAPGPRAGRTPVNRPRPVTDGQEPRGPAPAGAPARPQTPASPQALSSLLALRRSERTFDDRPITAEALRQLLWAGGGTVDDRTPSGQPRRTCASGGETHPLRWFAAVLRPLPSTSGPTLAPGLYVAEPGQQGSSQLHRLDSPAQAAWRWLVDPRAMRFASALLLPVADLGLAVPRYGNRGPLLAQLEAGAALQNMQLMAAALGVAGCLRGDVMDPALLPSLGLDAAGAWMPFAGYLVGQPPTSAQRQAQQQEHWLDMTAAPDVQPANGRWAWTAGPVRGAGTSVWTLGRAADPAWAVDKAEAEAWERKAWLTPVRLDVATGVELPGARDPSDFIRYSDAQRRRAGFPFTAYDAGRTMAWCAGTDVLRGVPCHLPADCIHPWTALPASQPRHTAASTSGVAAWTDPEGALTRAVLELVERDAALRAWLSRSAPPQIEPDSLPSETRQRLQALEDAGHRVHLLALPSNWGCTAAVFVQHRSHPFTGLTSAAAFDWLQAVDKALDEAEGRAAWAACAPPRALSARQIQGPEDIHAWWCSRRAWHLADALAASAEHRSLLSLPVPVADWSRLRAALADAGHSILSFDLTPPQAAIHQGRQPLSVVRACVSGLLPVWFQPGQEPAGLPAFRQALGRHRRLPAPIHPLS